MPTLHIVRGLPGSGKSTFARELSAKTGAMLIEPDALLVQDGEYKYTDERYTSAFHVANYIINDAIVICGADCIYADVLPTIQDVKKIIRLVAIFTDNFTYEVHDMPILSVDESMARNKHKVRKSDIVRMAKEWEPWEEGK